MIDIENFEREFEEIKRVHTYIQKKFRRNLIILIVFQVVFWSGFIFFSSVENVPGTIIFFLLAFGTLGFIYPLVINRQRFMTGNFFEKISKYFYEQTKYKLVINKNNKENRNKLTTTSNIINRNFSTSFNLAFDVYSQENTLKPLLNFYYGTYNYGKNVAFSGSVITIECEIIKSDYKILGSGLSSLVGNYSRNKDLTKSKDNKFVYYYNKKNETEYDEKLDKILTMLNEMLNNSDDYYPCGIGINNGKLTILIPLQGKEYNFSFIRKFDELNIEKYMNNLLNVCKLVDKINEEMSE